MTGAPAKTYGILAGFESPAALLRAAERVRDAGFKRFDCHSPFPIHGMEQAMGMKGSSVGFIAGIIGALGGIGGYVLLWWTSAVDYPFIIAGKPYNSYQAWVPIVFGFTVLFSAIGAVIGMLITNRLPKWFDGRFYSEHFSRHATDDGFYISIDAEDSRFDADKNRAFLESIGARHVEVLQGP